MLWYTGLILNVPCTVVPIMIRVTHAYFIPGILVCFALLVRPTFPRHPYYYVLLTYPITLPTTHHATTRIYCETARECTIGGIIRVLLAQLALQLSPSRKSVQQYNIATLRSCRTAPCIAVRPHQPTICGGCFDGVPLFFQWILAWFPVTLWQIGKRGQCRFKTRHPLSRQSGLPRVADAVFVNVFDTFPLLIPLELDPRFSGQCT